MSIDMREIYMSRYECKRLKSILERLKKLEKNEIFIETEIMTLECLVERYEEAKKYQKNEPILQFKKD